MPEKIVFTDMELELFQPKSPTTFDNGGQEMVVSDSLLTGTDTLLARSSPTSLVGNTPLSPRRVSTSTVRNSPWAKSVSTSTLTITPCSSGERSPPSSPALARERPKPSARTQSTHVSMTTMYSTSPWKHPWKQSAAGLPTWPLAPSVTLKSPRLNPGCQHRMSTPLSKPASSTRTW